MSDGARRDDGPQDAARLDAALAAWRSALGDEFVVTDAAALDSASTATFATTQRVLAILRPADTAGVQACLREATRSGVPVHPVSRGRNWGLGSRVPPTDGCALIDLSRMDRIVGFDEDLAYLTVEPGVSFRQASDWLRERGSSLFLSVIGGPPDASIIGNTVERGDGLGPLGDRLTSTCGYEVVLPDGEILRTGFARFDGAKAAPLAAAAAGPHLAGLFTQSNLGVVTRLTVWLTPRPEHLRLFTFTVAGTAALPSAVDALRSLALRGVVQPNCLTLWNAYKLMARQARYPWRLTGGQTPLDLEARYGARVGAPAWYGCGALYCHSEAQAAAECALVAEALDGRVATLSFTDAADPEAAIAARLFLGVPDDANVASVYWRKKSPPPAGLAPDPDRDRCGVTWIVTALPFTGSAVIDVARLVEKVVLSHGFEPNLALHVSSGRLLGAFIALHHDRDVPLEDQRAMACHDDLMRRLVDAGYPPTRLGIHSMQAMPTGNDATDAVLRRIRSVVDPRDVLSPGRYEGGGD